MRSRKKVRVTQDDRVRAAYAQLAMAADALDLPDDDRPFEERRDELVEKLLSGWGKTGHRTALVHTENVNQAFLRATVRVLDTPEVKAVFPYWRFMATLDQRTSQFCDALANVVRPAGESWWYEGRIPPLHMGGCRSILEPLTMKEAHKIGVTQYYPLVAGDIHHGYGYANKSFQPDLSKFPPELVQIYVAAVNAGSSASSLLPVPHPS